MHNKTVLKIFIAPTLLAPTPPMKNAGGQLKAVLKQPQVINYVLSLYSLGKLSGNTSAYHTRCNLSN